MMSWWSSLSSLNQALYMGAAFFSVFLVGQLVLSGVEGGDDSDGDVDGGGDIDGDLDADLDADGDADLDADDADFDHHGHSLAGVEAIWTRLLSRRSILAFSTLFCWGGALYLQAGRTVPGALGRAALWGCVGSVCVSALAFVMTRLDDRPDAPLSSVVGESARVHLPIPPGAMGEVRVLFGGRIQYLRAVATDEAADFRIGDDVVVMGARPDGILRVAAAREVFGDLPGPRRLADNQEPTT